MGEKKGAKSVIVAIPVAAREVSQTLAQKVDKCVILEEPENFRSVSDFYKDFRQVSEEEVINLLSHQSSVLRY